MTLTTLYRPVGQTELDLIAASNIKAYAEQIAKERNTEDEFSGYDGYVSAFDLSTAYLK